MLFFGYGKGRCAVAQVLTLIRIILIVVFFFWQVIHGRFVAGFYFSMLSNWPVKLAPFHPVALLQTETSNEVLAVIITLIQNARYY